MTLRYFFYLFIFSMFIACTSESATEKKTMTAEDIDIDMIDAPPPTVDSSSTAAIEEEIPSSPTPMTEKEKKAVEELKVKRKEIVKEQLSSSPFKNCEDALARYKEITEDYIAGKNRWKEWDANDVVYNSCKNKPDYKPQYDALQTKMDEYDDE